MRELADSAWRDATKRKTPKRRTLKKARAAIHGARANIVDWLSEQIINPPASMPATAEQLADEVGQLLAGPVEKALDRALSDASRRDGRLALADHFFCGLLAEFAYAIQELGEEFSDALDEIVSAIIESRIADHRSRIEDFLIRLAVITFAAGVKEIISRLSLVGHIADLQRAMRIIAILICPAPEKHRAVVQYCIDPLEEPIITAAIRQQLTSALPR